MDAGDWQSAFEMGKENAFSITTISALESVVRNPEKQVFWISEPVGSINRNAEISKYRKYKTPHFSQFVCRNFDISKFRVNKFLIAA
jgi:hypothetical protein